MSTEQQTPVSNGSINLNSIVKAQERYKKFLQIASLFMKTPLTPVEISIMDEFYHIEQGAITTESRKVARENLNMSAENLNNYIRVLRKKNIIIDNSIRSSFLQPLAIGDTMLITIALKVEL